MPSQVAAAPRAKVSVKREISQEKKDAVKMLQKLAENSRVVAIASIDNIGSRQINTIRKNLRGQAIIKVAKNTLARIAIKQASKKKPGLEDLNQYVRGNSVFLFTDMDPFKLGSYLANNRSKAPARVKQIAPKDIIIPAGNTGFQPGPVITQLQNVGVKTKIQAGTIHVAEDTVIAKTGDEISLNMVIVLSRLKIEPMEIALELTEAYEDGVLIPRDLLKMDSAQVSKQVAEASMSAFNVAMKIGHVTKETILPMVTKAYNEALSVALEASITTSETVSLLLARAKNQALSVGSAVAKVDPTAFQIDTSATATTTSQAQAKTENKPSEEKKEEKPQDVGLGSLFG